MKLPTPNSQLPRRGYFWLAITLYLISGVQSQETSPNPLDRATQRITAEQLRKHVVVLADDRMEGRNTGYPGNDRAAEYIAERFGAVGLKAVGDKNDSGRPTYFQRFVVKKIETRNCLGVMEGNDPVLKREVVVIGAHFDHVGRVGQNMQESRDTYPGVDPNDTVWNGADDNASGVAALLEIARVLIEEKVPLKRTVLFIAFGAEEWGLLGSTYYTEHPVYPLSDTVALINLDMIGRNPDRSMEVNGVGTSPDWDVLLRQAAEGTGVRYETTSYVSQGSDQWSFAQKRVPAIQFFTGFHADYHCPSDHLEKLSFPRLEQVARMTLRLVAGVAEAPRRLTPTFEELRVSGLPRPLGIIGEDLNPDEAEEAGLGLEEGGIVVASLHAKSVAEAAGLKSGDILVEFAGRKLPRDGTMAAFRRWLADSATAAEVPVVVLRDRKRTALTIRWPKE